MAVMARSWRSMQVHMPRVCSGALGLQGESGLHIVTCASVCVEVVGRHVLAFASRCGALTFLPTVCVDGYRYHKRQAQVQAEIPAGAETKL